MREEDEIRAAVIALAEAEAAGEDVSAELPHGEVPATVAAGPFDAEASEEEQRDAAIALVLDAVRTATRESRLSQPAEWEAAGLVPPCMTAEDLEMAVYDALAAHGEPVPEGGAACTAAEGDGAAAPARPVNKHVASPFSSSNGRCVGASPFKKKAVKEEGPQEEIMAKQTATAEERKGGAGCPDRAQFTPRVLARSARSADTRLGMPFGHSQSEDCLSESGYPAPPLSEEPQPENAGQEEPQAEEAPEDTSQLPYNCENIRLLMGAASYYLYDAGAMTDAYARWAFLAAEDDPVATFVECVREESSVYPRPMAVTSLANDPFRMDADAVHAAFDAARAQGRADDIERVCASNGDEYFYSTRFLSPLRAQALAEWDAVERRRNV